MKISRFLLSAIAADGGTIFCRVLLDDGSELDLGLDGRIPKRKKDRVVFVGASYPSLPGAKVLARDSKEESEVLAAVTFYTHLNPQDESARDFLSALIDR